MKIFRTVSPAVVSECQQNFNFLPIESQLEIRTAKFLRQRIHYYYTLNDMEKKKCLLLPSVNHRNKIYTYLRNCKDFKEKRRDDKREL